MERTISRRGLVAGAAALAAGAAAIGVLNVENAVAAQADGSLVYEGIAQGLRGWVTVHVTLTADGGTIEAVDVVRSTEQPDVICGKAIDAVPQRIVDGQSTVVDGVTGATFTSNAIMAAAAQALEAAGVAESFATPVHHEPDGSAQDVACDVLVLGAGGAGCMAALAARYEDFGQATPGELNVILVERQGFYGGSSMLSGGSISATMPINDNSNVERLFDDFMAPYEGGEFPANVELTRNMLMNAGENIMQIQALGYPLDTHAALGDPESYGSLTSSVRPYRYATEYYSADHWPWQGDALQHFFDERFETAGVDVRLDTEVLDLVVDESGSVVGARVSGPDGEYEISAKKTIMAMGGIAQSRDMLEKYAPEYVNALPYTNASCRGDGIRMAVEDVDAVVYGNTSTGMLGPDIHTGFWSDLGAYFPGWNSTVMLVNAEGARFMYDGDGYDIDESYRLACQQSNSTVYAILDSDNPSSAKVLASTMDTVAPHIFQADSIEDLAAAAGIDTAGLTATVDAYNASYDAGEDDAEFAVPNAAMSPVKTAPFFAVSLQPYAYGTGVGLDVSGNCEVLNSAGEIVPNLYAVGEMCWTGTMRFLGSAMINGRLAGEHAKAAIQA